MTSTQNPADDSAFNQARYASSSEFERGLLANLVAKRCTLIDAAADRELIWFVQYLSHRGGGLAAVARDLLARYAERIGTPSMLEIGKGASGSYTAEQVRKIRMELPPGYRAQFPLKYETRFDLMKLNWDSQENKLARSAEAQAISERVYLEFLGDEAGANCDASEQEIQREQQRRREEAEKHPTSYPVRLFRELCQRAAGEGIAARSGHAMEDTPSLKWHLSEMCLNPEWNLAAGGPWYFRRLVETLREYLAEFVKSKGDGMVVTELGKKVADELDYTLSEGLLTLFEGGSRTGKSFSARAWCEQHPGAARFIEVPPGNDERGFFHALARGLGLGNFASYSPTAIRERVESVLLTGDIILVLDEAQKLWPQRTPRYRGEPKRIGWVMKWVNEGVPIAMISTPQFIETQKAMENCGWNSAQLTGRLYNYVPLPVDLSVADLMAVAKAGLPEASDQVLRVLAAYAQESARYLAGIDSISKRARWNAKKDGRKTVTIEDVRKAMQESVIPADTKLQLALAAGKKLRLAVAADVPPVGPPDDLAMEESRPPRNRPAESVTPAPASRRANLPALVAD